MKEEKTREELLKEFHDKLQETENASYMNEIAIPGVDTSIQKDEDK